MLGEASGGKLPGAFSWLDPPIDGTLPAMRGTYWQNILVAVIAVLILALVRWLTGWPA